MYKYIETPLLVVMNQYDSNQIFDTVGFCPRPNAKNKAEVDDYVAYYGSLTRNSIEPQIKGHGQTKAKGKDGLFLPSCLAHGGFSGTTVQSVSNYVDLIGDWFFQRGKYPSHVIIDDCNMTAGLPCNAGCKKRTVHTAPSPTPPPTPVPTPFATPIPAPPPASFPPSPTPSPSPSPASSTTAASAKTPWPTPAKLPTVVATIEVGGTTEAELVKDSALQTKLVTGFANVVGVDAGDVTITRIGDTDVSKISRRLLQRQLSRGVSVSFEVVTTSSLEAAALKSKVVATPVSKITASFEAAGATGMTVVSKFTAVVTVVDAKKDSGGSGDTAAIAGGVGVGGVVLLMAVYVCGKMHGQEQPKGNPSQPTGAVVQSTEMVMVPAAAPAAEA